MKIVGVIPARYKSSRFPGKPLAEIRGKPMIWWVYQQAKKVPEFSEIYVATDDKRIFNVCREYKLDVVMTSEDHATGSDRVAEVAELIDGDIYINIQGDEPLIEPEAIQCVIQCLIDNPSIDAVVPSSKITTGSDIISNTVSKVAFNQDGDVIYISRSPIPSPKGKIGYDIYKGLGMYGYTKSALKFFKTTERGVLEETEDIEILRLIENHKIVKTITLNTNSIGVDTPLDLERVEIQLRQKLNREKY